MKQGVIGAILILVTVCRALPYGESHITRINEQGTIIEGPYEEGDFGYLGWHRSDSRVSDTGYIYFDANKELFCYSNDLSYISDSWDDVAWPTVAIDEPRGSIITETYSGSVGVLDLTLQPKYYFSTSNYAVSIQVDETDGSIWYAACPGTNRGLYKYSELGELIYHFPEYDQFVALSEVSDDGSFWAVYNILHYPYIRNYKKHSSDGQVIVESFICQGYLIGIEASETDGGLWVLTDDSEIYKINAQGSIAYQNSNIDDLTSISVNRNDGSVWLGTYDSAIIHLDSAGNLVRYQGWFDKYVHEIAVDPSDNSVIVFSSDYLDSNIQPSSLGEIKALFK